MKLKRFKTYETIDWENEFEIQEEPIDKKQLEKSIILYDTYEEVKYILKRLKEIGYNLYDNGEVESYWNQFHGVRISNFGFYWVLAIDINEYPQISFEEFKNNF